jgi:hypothetical protein
MVESGKNDIIVDLIMSIVWHDNLTVKKIANNLEPIYENAVFHWVFTCVINNNKQGVLLLVPHILSYHPKSLIFFDKILKLMMLKDCILATFGLLADKRVAISAPPGNFSPFNYALKTRNVSIVKYIIAYRGDEINWSEHEVINSMLEFNTDQKNAHLFQLVTNAQNDLAFTRHTLLLEHFNDPLAMIVNLFVLVVMMCDDFLIIKPTHAHPVNNISRFFNSAKTLPMELQMILCNRVYNQSKNTIRATEAEQGFKFIARTSLF